MTPIQSLEAGFDFGDGAFPVGRLAIDEERNVAVFEHDPRFISSKLRVNPFFEENELIVARAPAFYNRLHGVFSDSLPDAWGRLIMRRKLAAQGIDYGSLGPLDKLALVSTRGMGALIYRPDADEPAAVPEVPDLDTLANESLKILEGENSESIIQLERLGGSSGGARPKLLVFMNDDAEIRTHSQSGFSPWIVKFRHTSDPIDAGPLEAAYADMARAAGIRVSSTRLIPSACGPGYFATQRFDRGIGGARLHMVSAAAVFDVEWDGAAVDYTQLLNMARAVVGHSGVEEIFRRMLFNVLSTNRDDHARQHAFLMDKAGTWSLAPAYDLTFSYGRNGQHYLAVNNKGNEITVGDIRHVAREHSIKNTDEIINEVAQAVDRFKEFAESYDVLPETQLLAERQLRDRFNELGLAGYPR
jgi:serine/threonine-protein kinase HipA